MTGLMCHCRLGHCLRPHYPQGLCSLCLCFFYLLSCCFNIVIKKLFCATHLAVQEAETNFGAVNHASIIFHIDAALLPAAGRVVRRIPFYVLYSLQIFRGHFLQPVKTVVKFSHDMNKPVRPAVKISQRRQ